MSDNLRDLLHAAVPDAPAAPDRAAGARERARRTRRRTTVAVVAGSAALVAVAVLPALLPGPEPRMTPSVPTPSPTDVPPVDGAEPSCDDLVDLPSIADGTTLAEPTLCIRYRTAGPIAVPVGLGQLAILLRDRRRGALPDHPPGGPSLTLTGMTPQGGQVAAQLDDPGWILGGRSLQIVDELIAEAGDPTVPIDADSTPAEVLAAYAGRLNAGDRVGATALWASRVAVPALPAPDAYIGVNVHKVRPLPFVSSWRDAVAVTTHYRELPSGPGLDIGYYEVVFRLGRDEQGIFRILSAGALTPP